jgi:hypothetical protein
MVKENPSMHGTATGELQSTVSVAGTGEVLHGIVIPPPVVEIFGGYGVRTSSPAVGLTLGVLARGG